MNAKKVLVAVLVCGVLVSGPAMASSGGKVKPPVATTGSVAWYTSLFNLFSF